MTIGPEPMSIMRCRSARRGTDEIFDDRVEGELGRPSGRAPQLGRVTNQHRHVGGAYQRGILAQYRIDPDESKHALRERADVNSVPAGHVVDLAGRAAN